MERQRELENESVTTGVVGPSALCANPRAEMYQRVFLPLLHLLLPPPSHLLHCKMLQYFTAIMTKLVHGNLCRVFAPACAERGLLKAAAWRGASEYTGSTLPWGGRVYLSLHTLKLSHFL